MKLKHYSIFYKHQESKINWSYLRNNKNETDYFIPKKEEDVLKIFEKDNHIDVVDSTKKYFEKFKINRIISLGSGRSSLEYQLKLKTGVYTIISDITESILRLKKLDFFDEILFIDFTKKFELKSSSNTIILLPRIDTELSDSQMKNLFKNLNYQKVKYILFIPAQLLSIKSILVQFYIIIKAILLKKTIVDCGYSRSRSSFKNLWKEFYDIHINYNYKYLFLINKGL
jgi:hypothetical protein